MTRIFLADAAIRPAQQEAIRRHLPAGWSLDDEPAGVAAIVTENAPVTGAMLAAAGDDLRLIFRLDTGDATVAETAVPVVELTNTALVGVAEHAMLLLMALSRSLPWVTRQTAAEAWLPDRATPILTDQTRYTYNWVGLENFGVLYGKTVGIVGLGRIGRAFAARARAFGMRVQYTQRTRLDPAMERRLGVRWAEWGDLFATSDFVSLHHRFQEGERDDGGNDAHIGAREFDRMKPTAFFINTARGRMVDEDALVRALETGQIAGAGLDVFRHEPLPPDSPLLRLAGDRVLLTAHVGGAPSAEATEIIAAELVERLTDALADPLATPPTATPARGTA